MRTVVAINDPALASRYAQEAESMNEVWIDYPDDTPPLKAKFPGDPRAAFTPWLAHKASCIGLRCPALPRPVLSCPALSCPVLSCMVLPFLVLRFLVASCAVLSCSILSCPCLSCSLLAQLCAGWKADCCNIVL